MKTFLHVSSQEVLNRLIVTVVVTVAVAVIVTVTLTVTINAIELSVNNLQ
ncbi:hypothetical protein [Candidatus Uabimicrobium amorphum]